MSLFAKAVGAVAGATANVANKYVDEALARERAQFMAELQRTTSGQIRQDALDFETDPTNVQRVADAQRTKVLSDGQARRDAEKAGWSDTEYQGAKRQRESEDAAAKRSERVLDFQAETPLMAERQTMLERIRARFDRSGRGGGDSDPFAKLPPAVRAQVQTLNKQAEQINAAMVKAQADGMWEPDKNKSQSDLVLRLRVLEDKAVALLNPYIPKQDGGKPSPDDEIRRFLLGEQGAPAEQPQGKGGKPLFDRAKEGGPMAGADERTLRRLAAIDGHANQKAAVEELRRRGIDLAPRKTEAADADLEATFPR